MTRVLAAPGTFAWYSSRLRHSQPGASTQGLKPVPVEDACRTNHSDGMAKDAAVTVRIPLGLKRRLAAVARKERRSLSAQITAMLE